MSCGLGVGPSQTSLFGEPEAGLIPLNFVIFVWAYAQWGVASFSLKSL